MFRSKAPVPPLRPAVPTIGPCDRCGAPGLVRVAKPIVVLRDDTVTLDLILCSAHHVAHAPELRRKGWREVQVAA